MPARADSLKGAIVLSAAGVFVDHTSTARKLIVPCFSTYLAHTTNFSARWLRYHPSAELCGLQVYRQESNNTATALPRMSRYVPSVYMSPPCMARLPHLTRGDVALEYLARYRRKVPACKVPACMKVPAELETDLAG